MVARIHTFLKDLVSKQQDIPQRSLRNEALEGEAYILYQIIR